MKMRSKVLSMFKSHRIFFLMALSGLVIGACDDDNDSTLAALDMPGEMVVVERCEYGSHVLKKDETACEEAGGKYFRYVYVANMGTGTVSYVPFYSGKAEFEVIDITKAVPGVTSIPAGDRPQSLATDAYGTFVVLTSAVNNNLSIISVNDNREIAYQELDKTPRKIVWHSADSAFYVFFLDGTFRKLEIQFDCGEGEGILPLDCVMTRDMLTLTWSAGAKLDGTFADFVTDPVRNRGYATFTNRRYVSVVGFDENEGACLDGSTRYPCEIARYGAGFSCSDGIDNDGNGQIDSQDPSCFYPWSVEGTDWSEAAPGWVGIGECHDFIDNNGNGLFDALDPGCVSSNDASEDEGFQPMTMGTCLDGIDNDGDGKTDRDDEDCLWPTDDESGTAEDTVGLCRDGIDNDGDGDIDGEDLACYGSHGFSETPLTSSGRGAVSIDPEGRWLYVLDPEDSQLLVLDLETGKTLERSGYFPRNRVAGIPVSRLALDVEGDVRQDRVYNKNGHQVFSDRAIAFVSSSSGAVAEYVIFETLTQKDGDEIVKTMENWVLSPTDTDDDEAYIGVVRCVSRICTESDLPTVTLRNRQKTTFFTQRGEIDNTWSDTGLPYTEVYDAIIASETWRVAYEGSLEQETRTDGYFTPQGDFHTDIDLCQLGAQIGDHLVLTNRKGLINDASCAAFQTLNLEWEITDVGPHQLSLKPTGNENDVAQAPDPICFTSGLSHEIRASGSWIITSKSTYVNRRYTVGTHCVDNPMNPFGNMRFKIDEANADKADVQNAFFSLKMPQNASKLVRDDAFEFTTRTGHTALTIGLGAAPVAIQRFSHDDAHFLLISESSLDSFVIYDVDDESIDDTL